MKARELRSLSDEELRGKLLELRQKLFQTKLHVKAQTGEVKDTSLVRKLRRDVARIYTVLRERVLGTEKVESRNREREKE